MDRCGHSAACTALIASGALAGAHAAELAPLHVIPTENHSTESIAADHPARVRLITTNAQGLAQTLGVNAPAGVVEYLEYVVDQYPQLRGAAERSWLESTFVIDFTEPVFETLRKELGDASAPAQLVHFVAHSVADTADRRWDLASVVARRRAGDCTEHAVLTTALARMHGIPARVALGLALISDGESHGAFGHAWTEILEDGKWRVADAALFDTKATVRYIPLGVLDDEGMGYSMDVARLMSGWVDRVVVLGPAK